jgi:hypothetical protein
MIRQRAVNLNNPFPKQPKPVNRVFEFRQFLKLIKREMKADIRLPITRTLFAWRHGFLRQSALLYNFDKSNVKQYVSDYVLYCKTPQINGRFNEIVNNKIIFERFLQNHPGVVPENYFFLHGTTIMSLNRKYSLRTTNDIMDLFFEKGAMVIKPFAGGGGKNINIFKCENGELLHNQKRIKKDDLHKLLSKLRDCIGCEFAYQADYAARIFPYSTNTIRMLTMWDADHQPFLASAIHRFGSTSTIPLDNFAQGGLCAFIDATSGVMSKAITIPSNSQIQWRSSHPDTDQPIEGTSVAGWEEIKRQVLKIAESLEFVPYIGWDVVKTRDGIKIIEANGYSGVRVYQVHKPLLTIPGVKDFYQRHHIL